MDHVLNTFDLGTSSSRSDDVEWFTWIFEIVKNTFKNSSRTHDVHGKSEIIKNTFKNSSRTPESTNNSRKVIKIFKKSL